MSRTLGALTLALVCSVRGDRAAAQTSPPDTSEVAMLEELVVTADRAMTPLAATVGAVTRIDGEELGVTRLAGVAEALRLAPGFALVDRDGSGLDPQPIVRGFYGGGEAEYVVVLLDGRPLNALQSGMMAWELVPPGAIEAIEIVRGPASSLYGDAAIGGVINLISSRADDTGGHVRLVVAEDGLLRGGARLSGRLAGRPVHGYVAGVRSDGFREHGSRDATNVALSYDLMAGDGHALSASVHSTWMTFEQPGPLPAPVSVSMRRRSDAFYRFDETDERVHIVGVDGSLRVGAATLSGRITTDVRRTTDTRTIPLSPDFADTKERDLGADRVAGTLQVVTDGLGLSWPGRAVAGVDLEAGRLESEYRPVVSGKRVDYASSMGERGAVDARGEGRRRSVALFAQLEVRPVPALRLTAGVRVDRLSDRFESLDPSQPETLEAAHTAVSPKIGASLRWLDRPGSRGSVYATLTRSFKAATLDQLFDQRTIPVPFPPFSATTSNARLVPQTGVGVEAGAYHELASASSGARVGLSLSAYQMEMEDELDFDLATLQYVNIGRSRHRGVEGGLRLVGLDGRAMARVGYTLQAATSRAGDTTGRYLRAIPRHTWAGGASGRLAARLEAGVDVVRSSGAWFDAENTVRLRGFTRVDAHLSVRALGGTVFVDVRNVLDEIYHTTGFPDPSGSGAGYIYPSAGRTVGVGVTLAW